MRRAAAYKANDGEEIDELLGLHLALDPETGHVVLGHPLTRNAVSVELEDLLELAVHEDIKVLGPVLDDRAKGSEREAILGRENRLGLLLGALELWRVSSANARGVRTAQHSTELSVRLVGSHAEVLADGLPHGLRRRVEGLGDALREVLLQLLLEGR